MEFPELVSKSESLYRDGPFFLRNAIQSRGLDNLLEKEFGLLYRKPIYHRLLLAADSVEPKDRILGIDPESIVPPAFMSGAVLALTAVKEFIPRDFIFWEGYVFPSIVETDDEDHEEYLFGAACMDDGGRGYANAGQFDQVIEEFIDEICPDIRGQLYVKAGFGFALRMVDQYMEEKRQIDLDRMNEGLGSFDFDRDFGDGLNEWLKS